MGPQEQLGWVWEIWSSLGFDPRTVQPVASRYTVCVIPFLCARLRDIKTQKTIKDPIFIAVLFKPMLILIYDIVLSFARNAPIQN